MASDIQALLADQSILFYYRFDTPSDTSTSATFLDVSTQGTNITRTGGTIDVIGGLKSYNVISTTTPIRYTQTVSNIQNITYSTWIYLTQNANSYTGVLFSRANSSVSGMYISGLNIHHSWNDVYWDQVTTANVPGLNQWTHVALVISPTNAKFYINGTLQQTRSNTYAVGSFAEIAFGIDGTTQSRKLPGYMRHATVFTRSLSDSEVALLYGYGTSAAETVPGKPPTISATPDTKRITLVWSTSPNGGSPVTGYTITSSVGSPVSVSASTRTYTFTNLTSGTSYSFTIYATNSVGNSENSTVSNVVPSFFYGRILDNVPNSTSNLSNPAIDPSTGRIALATDTNEGVAIFDSLGIFIRTIVLASGIDGREPIGRPYSVVFDSQGNLYVGYYKNLRKYSPTYTLLWGVNVPTSFNGFNGGGFQRLAMSPTDNVFLITFGSGTVVIGQDVNNVNITATLFAGSPLVIKYNSDGKVLFYIHPLTNLNATFMGNLGVAHGIFIDDTNNLYLRTITSINAEADFGNNVKSLNISFNSDFRRSILVQYNASGVAQWCKNFREPQNGSYISAITCDASGNLYAVSSPLGDRTLTVGTNPTPTVFDFQHTFSNPNAGSIIVKFGPTGNYITRRVVMVQNRSGVLNPEVLNVYQLEIKNDRLYISGTVQVRSTVRWGTSSNYLLGFPSETLPLDDTFRNNRNKSFLMQSDLNLTEFDSGYIMLDNFTRVVGTSFGLGGFTNNFIRFTNETVYMFANFQRNTGHYTDVKVYTTKTSGNTLVSTFETQATQRVGYFARLALPPTSPLNPLNSAGDGQITLSWSPPSNGANFATLTYTIYNGNTNQAIASNIVNTTVTVSGLTNGTIYTYYIRAFGDGVQGSATQTISATPINLSQPTEVITSLGINSSAPTQTVATGLSVIANSVSGLSVEEQTSILTQTVDAIYEGTQASTKVPDAITATNQSLATIVDSASQTLTVQTVAADSVVKVFAEVAAQTETNRITTMVGSVKTIVGSILTAFQSTATSSTVDSLLNVAPTISEVAVSMLTSMNQLKNEGNVTAKETIVETLQSTPALTSSIIPISTTEATILFNDIPNKVSDIPIQNVNILIPATQTIDIPIQAKILYTPLSINVPYIFQFQGESKTLTYNGTTIIDEQANVYAPGASIVIGGVPFRVLAVGTVALENPISVEIPERCRITWNSINLLVNGKIQVLY